MRIKKDFHDIEFIKSFIFSSIKKNYPNAKISDVQVALAKKSLANLGGSKTRKRKRLRLRSQKRNKQSKNRRSKRRGSKASKRKRRN